MPLPCLHAFSDSHCLRPKSKLSISMTHRLPWPDQTYAPKSQLCTCHWRKSVRFFNLARYCTRILKGFSLCCSCSLESPAHVCSPVTSYPYFQTHSGSPFSKLSLDIKLLNNPTLCSLSTFCIFYHIILKLSIYLSGFLISSWRAQTIWTHIAIVVSIFHLIQTSYNFVLSIWVFTFYVTVVSPSWGWKPIKG